jgi:adenosylcobinamide kinase / adenosylcobinamide-phosphate guanylyltransferase
MVAGRRTRPERACDWRICDWRAEVTSPTTTLVLGGARSGKSAFAEQLVRNGALRRIYLATATPGDEEMRSRIAHHRIGRGDGWTTVEEPLELTQALARESDKDCVVLVDCLTPWLSNVIHAAREPENEVRHLAEWLSQATHPVVLVSNEIGLGLVPETPLGRGFRDAQGRLNQTVAAAVPNVVFVAAGLPIWLKGKSPMENTSP